MNSGDPIIEVEGLARRYSGREALTHVSFRVDRGESVALLGPNGSGKTTLLRVLAGVVAPSAGVVRVAGFDADMEAERMRGCVGYLAEKPGLPPEMPVREYLRFRGGLKGLRGNQLAAQVGVAMQQCGLMDVAGYRAGGLSHGMQRRVGFAETLLADPDVLLLDEPHSGLDLEALAVLREWILGVAHTRAVVFSTHRLDEAAVVATRALVLSGGRLAGDFPLTAGKTPDGEPLEAAYVRLTGQRPGVAGVAS